MTSSCTSGARAESYAGTDYGFPVLQILEAVLPEPIMDSPVPQIFEDSLPACTTGARATSYAGADPGFPCASDHGGQLARFSTGARALSYAGADRGFPCASDHGGRLADRTTGARAKSCCGADCGCPCASDRSGERAESYAGAGLGFPVPQTMEAVVKVSPPTPQERVFSRMQERVQNRPRKLFVDVPVPHIMEQTARKVMRTGKVFTVLHHRDEQAFTVDTLGFNIKGLDKCTMPRSGDVMVPALHMEVPVPQIAEEIVKRPVTRERIIERFGHSILFLLGCFGSFGEGIRS